MTHQDTRHRPTNAGASRVGYPDALAVDTVEVRHGYRIADPYRWLEDAAAPDTRRWREAQRALVDDRLGGLPGRAGFLARLREIEGAELRSVPKERGDRLFSVRDAGDGPSVLVVGVNGEERTVLTPSGTTMLDAWSPSPDGRLLAYQTSDGGDERSTLWIMDVDSGERVGGPIDRVRRSPVAWLPDGSGFFYVRHAADRLYRRRVVRHDLADATATEVFGEDLDDTAAIGLDLSQDRWLVVHASTGLAPRNGVWLADVTRPAPVFTTVQDGLDALTIARVGPDGLLYLSTTHDAPKGRVCVADPAAPANWHELIPEDPDGVLSGLAFLGGELIVVRSRHGVHAVTVHDLPSGRPLRRLDLPGEGTIDALAESTSGAVWLRYTDHATPPTVLHYPALRPPPTESPRRVMPGCARRSIASRQVTYRGADGMPVRMFVIGDGEGGPRPLILSGYGGFGVPIMPRFDPVIAAWTEAGGVFAMACVRGGGDEGAAWHRAGSRGAKQTSFDDFHAAAEWLIGKGWTTPDRLGLLGASNAGLLVGAAVTQRPELYRAAVCVAPVLDMARYESSGLGASWRAEYGSAADPEELGWLMSYSPYHHVRGGVRYPAILFVVGQNDTRVDPMHARKMCALMQARTAGDRPVLLREVPDAGHGRLARELARPAIAEELAFLAQETGLA